MNLYEYAGNNPEDWADPSGYGGQAAEPPSDWPAIPTNIPGGPWRWYADPANSRAGEFRGPPVEGMRGVRTSLTWSPKGQGYWKTTLKGAKQRYDRFGNPRSEAEAKGRCPRPNAEPSPTRAKEPSKGAPESEPDMPVKADDPDVGGFEIELDFDIF